MVLELRPHDVDGCVGESNGSVAVDPFDAVEDLRLGVDLLGGREVDVVRQIDVDRPVRHADWITPTRPSTPGLWARREVPSRRGCRMLMADAEVIVWPVIPDGRPWCLASSAKRFSGSPAARVTSSPSRKNRNAQGAPGIAAASYPVAGVVVRYEPDGEVVHGASDGRRRHEAQAGRGIGYVADTGVRAEVCGREYRMYGVGVGRVDHEGVAAAGADRPHELEDRSQVHR